MHYNPLHAWDVSPQEAVALQKQLAAQIIHDRPLDLESVRIVAGVDVSVKHDESQAAIVVLSFPQLEVIEVSRARLPTTFPYIPGLLTFREGAVLIEAFKQLRAVPDVLIFDGMGRLHPRRIGIASHMGLWLERPTVGCGKTPFVGRFSDLDLQRGSTSPIIDRGETIGMAVRTRTNVAPVYISPGHLIDLESSVALIMACLSKYRLPEPIRAAHHAAGEFE